MFFIGNFFHVTNQEESQESERRHGEFNLVVDAQSPFQALLKFRDQIINYRQTSDFFQGDCTIYLIQLLEFDRFPVGEAMMLNYKSVAGDPLMPFIRCSVPNDLSDSCRIFEWKDSTPEIDGERERLFMQFEAASADLLREPDPAFLLASQSE